MHKALGQTDDHTPGKYRCLGLSTVYKNLCCTLLAKASKDISHDRS